MPSKKPSPTRIVTVYEVRAFHRDGRPFAVACLYDAARAEAYKAGEERRSPGRCFVLVKTKRAAPLRATETVPAHVVRAINGGAF